MSASQSKEFNQQASSSLADDEHEDLYLSTIKNIVGSYLFILGVSEFPGHGGVMGRGRAYCAILNF